MALLAPYQFGEEPDPRDGQAPNRRSVDELVKEYTDLSGRAWFYDPEVSAWANEVDDDVYATVGELLAARGTLLANWQPRDAS